MILLSSEQDITADRVKCGAHLTDHNTEYSRFGVNMILHIRDGKKVDGTNPYNLFDQLAASGENRFSCPIKNALMQAFMATNGTAGERMRNRIRQSVFFRICMAMKSQPKKKQAETSRLSTKLKIHRSKAHGEYRNIFLAKQIGYMFGNRCCDSLTAKRNA